MTMEQNNQAEELPTERTDVYKYPQKERDKPQEPKIARNDEIKDQGWSTRPLEKAVSYASNIEPKSQAMSSATVDVSS